MSRGEKQNRLGKFDRLAVSRIGGKWLAAGIILLGLLVSMIIAAPLMSLGSMLPLLADPVSAWLLDIGTAPILVAEMIAENQRAIQKRRNQKNSRSSLFP